jgi:hypothetical protein
MSSKFGASGRLGGLIDFAREETARLHIALNSSTGDLQGEQWCWTAGAGSRSIAAYLRQYARAEDALLHDTILRRPTVWVAGHFADRVPSIVEDQKHANDEQPTADILRLRTYVGRVWLETALWLNRPYDEGYELPVLIPDSGLMPGVAALAQLTLTEGFSCLGAIRLIRSMLQLPGS